MIAKKKTEFSDLNELHSKIAGQKEVEKDVEELVEEVTQLINGLKAKPNPQAQARAEKLLTALKQLGNGKNQIAASLKAKKIRGVVGDSEKCPIAIFVKKLFPSARAIDVCDSIFVEFKNSKLDFEIDTPKLIGQFINTFDGEKYPDLVKSI